MDKGVLICGDLYDLPLRHAFSSSRHFEIQAARDALWWKGLGSTYYGVGALANYLEAVDAFKSGDNVAGGLDVAGGVGATINAAAPFLVDLGVDEAVADWAGPVGAGIGFLAAVGTAIYDGIKGSEAQAAFQHDSSKFLQQGLGLKPDVADALSAPSGHSDGSSASAALQGMRMSITSRLVNFCRS